MRIKQPKIEPRYNAIYGAWGWILLEDYLYKDVLIPAGYWWNGANVPVGFWQLIYPASDQRLVAPSLVHDWLYSTHKKTRADSDAMLVSALTDVGVPEYKRVLVEKAVRTFGASAWKDTDTDKQYMMMLKRDITLSGRDYDTYL